MMMMMMMMLSLDKSKRKFTDFTEASSVEDTTDINHHRLKRHITPHK